MLAPLRTFEAVIPVTGALPGTLTDWPPHIQDPIYLQMARLEQRENLHLRIHHAVCEEDPDGFFLRVGLIEDPDILVRLMDGRAIRRRDLRN